MNLLLFFGVIAGASSVKINDKTTFKHPWDNQGKSSSERANLMLKEMTNEEKFKLIRGISKDKYYAGYTEGIPRLDIPPINVHDGPAGFGTK